MAKFDFKQFLLAKGEKIALGAGIAGLGLFGILGVMNAVSADSPTTTIKKLTDGAKNVNSKIASTGGTATPLPEWVVGGQGSTFKEIETEHFVGSPSFFEPVDFPSKLRENPKVLGITAAQLDLIRAPMTAFDIKVQLDGSRQMGVLTKVKVSEADAKKVTEMLTKSGANKRLTDPKQRNQNQPQPPGGGPAAPQGGGRGPGGRGGQQGGGSGDDGTGGGPGAGMMGGMMGGAGMFGGGGFDQQAERFEATVTYIPVEEFDKKNPVPAFTVYPLRMVVVHASFPLREQLEEIRRALRLQTVEDARLQSIPGATGGTSGGVGGQPTNPMGPRGMAGDGGATTGGTTAGAAGGPVFAGFEVQRRVTAPNGTRYDWADYNHEDVYVDKIWSRKVADQSDDGYLAYFLRYDQQMAMPLPALADGLGGYPEVNLKPIVEAVQKMKDLRKTKITPSTQQERFRGVASGNPFVPQSNTGGAAGGAAGGPGAGNMFGGILGDSGAAPGVGSGSMPRPGGRSGSAGGSYGGGGQQSGPPGMPRGPGVPGMPSAPGGRGQGMMPPGYGQGPLGQGGSGMLMRPGGPGGPGQPGGPQLQQTDTPERDHLLLRFLDPDVNPGFTYEYKIRVKMKNPNFLRKDVGKPDDAKHEVLWGDWVRINLAVTVTSELNLYAGDPVDYASRIRQKYPDAKDQPVLNLLDNRNGAVPTVQIQRWMEQVNIETKREPVGTWVVGEVPVHRGEYIGRKQLVPLPMWSAEKGTYILQELPRYKVWKAREQPKGLLVDFASSYVLVDYEGGKVRPSVADRSIDDEASSELLVLRPDGSLTVLSSQVDTAEPERKTRFDNWVKWIEAVTTKTQQVGQPTQPGGDGGSNFQRN